MVAKSKTAAKTAKVYDFKDDSRVDKPEEMSEPKDAEQMAEAVAKSASSIEVPTTGGFNLPKIVPAPIPKDGRCYGGPATRLMNALYDATEVPVIEELRGWEKIALLIAKACERLEKAGWKRGK